MSSSILILYSNSRYRAAPVSGIAFNLLSRSRVKSIRHSPRLPDRGALVSLPLGRDGWLVLSSRSDPAGEWDDDELPWTLAQWAEGLESVRS